MSELLPCPFCNGSATKTIGGTPELAGHGYWVIGCYFNTCTVKPVFYAHHMSEAEAITAWNTRSSPPVPSEGLVGALERIAYDLIDQQNEPWTEEGGASQNRVHYWRDKAIRNSQAIRAALSTIDTGRAREGWQPIETAPKDGTRIFVIGNTIGWQGYPFVVEWSGDWWRHTEPSLDALYSVSDSISHWMSLATPPALKDTGDV